ncbi:MAG TPA: hypothetical protein VGO37_06310 [Steroidobacteraceae bacterium]|nr:hypothetical protein [Steroidobacteraceae bacterium]
MRGPIAGGLMLMGLACSGWSAANSSANVGESIYLRGTVGSGAPVRATRVSGLRMEGPAAACVNCHRHSGLGTTEGRLTIPPITGRYLFQPRTMSRDEVELSYVEGVHGNRDPYTDESLARAIRDGLDSAGKPLAYLMPRFALGDSDMAALVDYLKKLDARSVPGVTDTLLHFATIITSDADPVKQRGMLDVIGHYFADKNTFPFPPTPRMRSSGKTLYTKSMYMANRRWQLHVWELSGPAATWNAQLEQHMKEEPVLAAVSGLGGANWSPVHQFCERARLPCLFPNVEVPVAAEGDFYSLYFSKGVLLEAELIAKRMRETGSGPPIRAVQQLYRMGDSGEQAASALAAALKGQGFDVRSNVLPRGAAGQAVAEALHQAPAADVLVLWLRPADLSALGEPPTAVSEMFMSGLMGGLENSPLPDSWRSRTRVAYPFDLPDLSRVRVNLPLEWFKIRRIPVVAEQVQVDTYLACGLLAETVSHMADTFGQDYLVERMDEMLEHRLMTGYYPRLTLAAGQRFASKGGYLLRFDGADGNRIHPDGGWLVP